MLLTCHWTQLTVVKLSPQLASGTTSCAQAFSWPSSLLMAIPILPLAYYYEGYPSRRLDSWSMLLECPTSTAKGLPTLIFVSSPKLGTKKPRVWVSWLLPHTPMTPRHCLLSSPTMKPTPLSNAFRRASPPLSSTTRAMKVVTFAERKDTGPTNVQRRLALQQSLTLTLPSPMDALWDLQVILDAEIHVGTMATAKKDKENRKHTNRVENIFLQWAQSPPSLSMDIPPLVLQVHAASVVYYPLNSDAH